LRVQLRGVIASGAGARSVEVRIPAEGAPLSRVLRDLEEGRPRLGRYLRGQPAGAAVRVILNDEAVAAGSDPMVREGDELTLLAAVAGGWL
jgi:molybdopterin converting factor small subunit